MNETTSQNTPEFTIAADAGWAAWRTRLVELVRARDLFAFLVWRNIKVIYKETVLGFAWAILRPVLSMVIFSVVFGRLARMPSDGLPYPLFAYVALVPWTYFSTALAASVASLVGSASIVTKVYFPRLLIPLASVVAGLLDFAIAFALIAVLMVRYAVAPTASLVWLPVPIALLVLVTAALSIWLSALAVRFRDVRFALPFALQLLLYIAPVVWPVSLVPDVYRPVYALYPLVGAIEGLRAAVLGRAPMPWDLIGIGALSATLLLLAGLAYFRRVDRQIADII